MSIVELFENGIEEVLIKSSKPIDASKLIQKEFEEFDYWYYDYAEKFFDDEFEPEVEPNKLFQVMIDEIDPQGPFCNVYQIDEYTVRFANEWGVI